jgi:hypothetical protein
VLETPWTLFLRMPNWRLLTDEHDDYPFQTELMASSRFWCDKSPLDTRRRHLLRHYASTHFQAVPDGTRRGMMRDG